jgi:hypothetical protein
MVRGFLQLCHINKYQVRHVHHKDCKTNSQKKVWQDQTIKFFANKRKKNKLNNLGLLPKNK